MTDPARIPALPRAGGPPAPVELSVVIPAYDEAGRIVGSLERIRSYLDSRGIRFEVVVADDGSDDGTGELVTALGDPRIRLVRLPTQTGKGAAWRRGVAATRGERVLLCDADLSTPIDNLERLEAGLERAEVAIGSRAVAGAEIIRPQPLHRRLMGKALNRLLRLLRVTEFRDTQCGFKLFDGEDARGLFPRLTIDGFACDIELLRAAKDEGLRIVEIGVEWRDSLPSRVRPLGDSAAMLRDLSRLALRRWLGSLRPDSSRRS